MRILAIVRDVALIVCAVTLTVTTLYFANEYRALRADLAALRALPGEVRERLKERVRDSTDTLREKARDSADQVRERARDTTDTLREKARDSADQLRDKARERLGRDKKD